MPGATNSPTDGPALVLQGADGTEERVALEVQPMVEVPSGTSGPWLVPVQGLTTQTRRQALAALETVCEQGDRQGQLQTDTGHCSWRLINTRVRDAAGADYTLCPMTVCWLDADGEPTFDCDHAGRPDGDLITGGERIGPYAFVADADSQPV
ncbi:MAG: hypothetical protein R6V11_02565 [Ectothiorhodospiraceae bacterium]